MRDPNRIPEVLAEVERVWKMYPDWRLGQLLVNVMNMRPNPLFNVEDTRLLDELFQWRVAAANTRKQGDHDGA